MYREIEMRMSDGTVSMVPFKATGGTRIWFKQLTGKDVIESINVSQTDTDKAEEAFSQLAYVMNKQATCKEISELSNLNMSDYIEWLDQFAPMEFIGKSTAIVNTYVGNTETESDAKKNPDQLTEKQH